MPTFVNLIQKLLCEVLEGGYFGFKLFEQFPLALKLVFGFVNYFILRIFNIRFVIEACFKPINLGSLFVFVVIELSDV